MQHAMSRSPPPVLRKTDFMNTGAVGEEDEGEEVRMDPETGRYHTLSEMDQASLKSQLYTKEESENYWYNYCIVPNREIPPPPARYDWFSLLFGFSEASWAEVERWLAVVPSEGGSGHQLVSRVNGASYSVGTFSTPMLREMRSRVDEFSLPGRLTVTNECGDVAAKHGENMYSTFQVASQFNCLEFAEPLVVPEDGVTGYSRDRTQGPACSIACGPATVYRNNFVQLMRVDEIEGGYISQQGCRTLEVPHRGQTRGRMINNLVNVSKVLGNLHGSMFAVQGGYTQSDESRLAVLNATISKLQAEGSSDDVRAALRVGVHEDVQVTSSNWGQQLLGEGCTVTQVFGSACAVSYSVGTKLESWEQFAILILEASYEATLCAALLTAQRHPAEPGARRVFLTSLGGGVFGNPMEWIVAAMRRACDRYKDYDLDVRVVTYAGEVHPLLRQLERDFSP